MGEHRGVQVAIAGVTRLPGEQPLDLRQRQIRLALAVEHHGIVVARFIEARRELEAAFEQLLRILVAAQPRGNLRQHTQRRDVGRVGLEVSAQARLCERQVVFDERTGGLRQARVACCCLEEVRPRVIRPVRIALRIQLIGEQSPGVRRIRMQQQRTSKRGARLDGASGLPERDSQLQLRRYEPRLLSRERRQDFERRMGLAADAPCRAEDQPCTWVCGK